MQKREKNKKAGYRFSCSVLMLSGILDSEAPVRKVYSVSENNKP